MRQLFLCFAQLTLVCLFSCQKDSTGVTIGGSNTTYGLKAGSSGQTILEFSATSTGGQQLTSLSFVFSSNTYYTFNSYALNNGVINIGIASYDSTSKTLTFTGLDQPLSKTPSSFKLNVDVYANAASSTITVNFTPPDIMLTGGAIHGFTIQNTINVAAPTTMVYVAGLTINNEAQQWQNGVPVKIHSPISIVGNSIAKSVFVSGSDVYVAGMDGYYPVYWKNGKEVRLDLLYVSTCNSIFVSGSDVYVVGQTNPFGAGTFYENGVQILLHANSPSPGTNASCVFVAGTDVYIAGYDYYLASDGSSIRCANYWKNGVETELITPNFSSKANSIFVLGTDTYVAGSYGSSLLGDGFAAYWKNGVMTPLTNGTPSTATSVFVSGSDLYIAGSDGSKAVYWKNGAEVVLGDGVANSIFVSGTDVYAAGGGVYWKNDGTNVTTTTLANAANVYSIFVK